MRAIEQTQAMGLEEQGEVVVREAFPNRSIVYLSDDLNDDSPFGICSDGKCRIVCPIFCTCHSWKK